MKDCGTINTYSDGALPNHTPSGCGGPVHAARVADTEQAARRWNAMVDIMVMSAHNTCPADNVVSRFGAVLAGIDSDKITKQFINEAMDAAMKGFSRDSH